MTADTRTPRWSLDDWNITEGWVKTYPAGRVCDHDGCATILSRYNATMYCGAHKPDTGLRFHGMAFGQCACGAVIGRKSKVCRPCADAERSVAMTNAVPAPRAIKSPSASARARKRQLDYYYIKTYGMTRDEYRGSA